VARQRWLGRLLLPPYRQDPVPLAPQEQQDMLVQGRSGESVPLKWMGLPTAADLKPFIGMASVLLSRTVFSMAAFTIITGAATARGTAAAATHQVCLQLFWFLSFFPEPLSVAAQSLIARDRSCRSRTLLLTRCILGLAAALGVIIAAMCSSFFYFGSGLFTQDAAVALGMHAIAPAAFAALILCSLAMAVDGISIGSDNYSHLPIVNFCGLASTAAYLHWCNSVGSGLAEVWLGMVAVFAVRLAVHAVHHFGHHASTSVIAEALNWRQGRKSPVRLMLPAPAAALA
jgi:Na+-driven multidrug efflux pump